MKTKAHEIFELIFREWLATDAAPESYVEAADADFGAWLAEVTVNGSLDDLRNPTEWGWFQFDLEFEEIFDGAFMFTFPHYWRKDHHGRNSVMIEDPDGSNISMFIFEKSMWENYAGGLFDRERVGGFAYMSARVSSYERWVFVTVGDSGVATANAVYGGGDWLIVMSAKMPARGANHQTTLLTAMMASDPWICWIDAALQTQE